VLELRYEGQSFELDVEAPAGAGDGEADADLSAIREGFEAEHERRYGYRDPEAAIEIVGIRVAAIGERPEAGATAAAAGEPQRDARKAWFARHGFVETAVIAGTPAAGATVAGPAVIELAETTLLVPPGAVATSGEAGIELTLELEAEGTG